MIGYVNRNSGKYLLQLLNLFGCLMVWGCGSTRHHNASIADDKYTVRIKNGVVTGAAASISGIRVFKGIPYAVPPVGKLRWQAPQPLTDSTVTISALRFGDNCMQGGGGPVPSTKPGEPANPYTSEYLIDKGDPQSENCLCLNVWTPARSSSDKLPVLVYIHGGGLGGGSGSIPLYNGEGLASKGIVMVTINYRLGIFGYFAHPALEEQGHPTGNFGLLDQVAALKWVRDNIYAFGGDPKKVTIMGTSAGAWSVSALLVSPVAKGLFRAAIAHSGGLFAPPDSAKGMNPFYSAAHAQQSGYDFMRDYPCTTLEELRLLPAAQLMSKKFSYGLIGDGHTLQKDIYTAFKKNENEQVPLLVGWNANDARGFGWQARTFANLTARNKKSKVYAYYFTKVAPGTQEEQALGAYHAAEMAYAFNTLDRWNRPWTAEDRKLSDNMSSYWANFAKTGDPNGKGLPFWPEYKSEKEVSLELGKTVKAIKTPWDEEYHYFNTLYRY